MVFKIGLSDVEVLRLLATWNPGLRRCISLLAHVLLHQGATPHRLQDRTAAHAAAPVVPTTPGRARRHQTLHQDRAWWAHSEPLLQTMLSTDDASRREYAISKILAIGGLEEALRKDQQASRHYAVPQSLNMMATTCRELMA